MAEPYDTSWDLKKSAKGCLPKNEEAFEKIYCEWERRDWVKWLGEHLTFPFHLKRMEDEDDAYFTKGAAHAPFRLGHKMKSLTLMDDEGMRLGLHVEVEENGKFGEVPLADCEVVPKTDPNFWPVREYVVWMANQ